MQEQTKERNYWPHAIVIGIILCIGACAWTIKIALDNPVEMDSFYLEKYQSVDRNFNDIMKKQHAFDNAYALEYGVRKFIMGKEEMVTLKIKDKQSGEYLQNADVTLMLTRPETNANNHEMKASRSSDGTFTFGPVVVEKPGRWQLLAKIKAGDLEGFNKYEVYATQ